MSFYVKGFLILIQKFKKKWFSMVTITIPISKGSLEISSKKWLTRWDVGESGRGNIF